MLLFIVARFSQFIIYLLVFIISYFKFINCYQPTKSECLQLLQPKFMLLQEKFRNSIKPEKVLLLLQKILSFGPEIYRSLLPARVEENKLVCTISFMKNSTRHTLHLILAEILTKENILALIILIIHVKKNSYDIINIL